jgi:hypothetical protein
MGSYTANPINNKGFAMKQLLIDGLLFSALVLSATTTCFAESQADIRYRRDQCDKVCEHEIRMREDRPPCYVQCKNKMDKELKTASKVIVPQYVARPGDCPITLKKDVEEILGIKIQKVIADSNRWMTCEFVSEDIIVRITNDVGSPSIIGRDPLTQDNKTIDDTLRAKLNEAAKRQINIWESHLQRHPNKISI